MKEHHIIQGQDILKTAIQALTALTGVTVKVLGVEVVEEHRAFPIDALVQMTFRSGKQQFYVEVKGEVRQPVLSTLLAQFGKEKDKWLLVAKYIPGPLKEELKKNGINYLEATGNCNINAGNIYLYINDREVKPVRQTTEGKLWNASGLKLLFVLIQDPQMIEATYRSLADVAGIALGSITPLMEELRREGYIKRQHAGEKEVLAHRSRLFARWTELYPLFLRPRLMMGSFRFLTNRPNDLWRSLQLEGVYWGGEPAGDLYTHLLVPEEFTIYTTRQATDLIKLLKIVPDEKGNIAVLQKFWKDWPGSHSVKCAVPPLLAYADLIDSSDSRRWEIAEKIKSDYWDGEFIS
ncbi:MAG TPA: type IV toxin-antitoxin system AbiEi family antitoxin [Puia sp.]|nr:type IV toxin-antitoxin system AbiEi family antitoxin [Puia sp.]